MRFTHGLEEGETVRITSGPFAECMGRLEHLDDSGRVRVLLDLLGQRFRFCCPRAPSFPHANWLELSPSCQAEVLQCALLTLALTERRRVPNWASRKTSPESAEF